MRSGKFIIEVNNKLDCEYIQKLAFNGGFSWWNKDTRVQSWEVKYLFFNSETQGEMSHGNSNSYSDRPLYKFPSQAEEIVKLFEKEKEPEFKVGYWVALLYTGGIRHLREDHFTNGKPNLGHLRYATPAEIEAKLIEEARKKGFVVGAKVTTKPTQEPFRYNEEEGKYTSIHCTTIEDKRAIEEFKLIDNKLMCRLYGTYVKIWWTIDCLVLAKAHPKIEINGYKAEFKDWGLDFNGGCAKIDYTLFSKLTSILDVVGTGNKSITSVKIGAGEFTASQIKEIADYYNNK